MNLLDIVIVAVLAFYMICGMYRGSITSWLSTAGFMGAFYGAKELYPRVANLALSNTTLLAVLNQYLEPETFFKSHSQAITAVADVVAGGVAGCGVWREFYADPSVMCDTSHSHESEAHQSQHVYLAVSFGRRAQDAGCDDAVV